MLKHVVQSERSATSNRLKKFRLALAASQFFLSRSNQLIFLCGANQATGEPSARREAIKKFIEKLSADNKVVYAEAVFHELQNIGRHQRNVLDLEHEISNIADKIVLILESPSAFCELGAFAHPALRKKLIVINNSAFEKQPSFINTGPIAALHEEKSPVLWYPMNEGSTSQVDGIGAVFGDLQQAVYVSPLSGQVKVNHEVSELSANKASLYFVHDLVLFTGPTTHEELVNVLVHLFGKKPYDMLKRLLGILRSAGLIHSYQIKETWIYRTDSFEPYLEYRGDISALTAAFRTFHLKNNPERFQIV